MIHHWICANVVLLSITFNTLYIFLSAYKSVFMSLIYLSIWLQAYSSNWLPTFLTSNLPAYLLTCLLGYQLNSLLTWLSAYLLIERLYDFLRTNLPTFISTFLQDHLLSICLPFYPPSCVTIYNSCVPTRLFITHLPVL